MGWQQHYSIFGTGVFPSALIAALPIAALLLLLGVLRRPAWLAALIGWITAMVLAVLCIGMPARLACSAAALGAAFGLFPITWIVFWAIALYRVTTEAGQFRIIQASLGSLTRDARLQALLIAYCLCGFLEGAAGFGTPVAISAAMLVGLGFAPASASLLCLFGNTAPVAFGSIGIPLVTLAGVTGLPLARLSVTVGALCAPLAAVVPVYMLVTFAGWRRTVDVWPACAVCGLAFGGCQFLVAALLGPGLADIFAALSAGIALVLLLRVWQPPANSGTERESPATTAAATGTNAREFLQPAPKSSSNATLRAWMPYCLLVFFVVCWGMHPVQALLNRSSMTLAWPGLHNLVVRVPPLVPARSAYPATYALNLLSAAGTACMFATFTSAMLLRFSPRRFGAVLLQVSRQLALPTITVAGILSMAFVMNYSGATGMLGLAFAASGRLFPFFSPLLGWLGVFLTGSDTSANALFGSMQAVTAAHLRLSPVLMASGNSAGGVMGKMISPQTIVIAAVATGMSQGEQSTLFRRALKHSIALVLVIGVEVLIAAHLSGAARP